MVDKQRRRENVQKNHLNMKMKKRLSNDQAEVGAKALRNSVSLAAVKRLIEKESEESSYSSYPSSDEGDIEAPEVGKEIKSEPQGKGKSLSQERPRSTERCSKTYTLEGENNDY